ncbi:hypothetical protein F511_29654 [Dorcoceras hygrometricum]|uniref:Uncharacterized protein n=1 Tax=Dorcoceras hygrometricum TaxID=472368 RepID=A0A2Z7C9C3_9LAMI|nr:hypothetical protein F511_29654 [Dorcoceras hygrometricum]
MLGSSSDGGRTAAAVASIACGAWPHAAVPSAATSRDIMRQGWSAARVDWDRTSSEIRVYSVAGASTSSFGLVGTIAFRFSASTQLLGWARIQLLIEGSAVEWRSAVDSSDESESGSVGLLLLRCFVSYPFIRQRISWKRIERQLPCVSVSISVRFRILSCWGFLGLTVGRGFDPAGGAPGGG